jgi:hypothetical protein
MKHLRLITGCEVTYVRQFLFETETEISLNDKECRQAMKMYEKKCSHVSTSVAANKAVAKLYVGTKEGAIFTYNPSLNSIQKTKIQVTFFFKIMSIFVSQKKFYHRVRGKLCFSKFAISEKKPVSLLQRKEFVPFFTTAKRRMLFWN